MQQKIQLIEGKKGEKIWQRKRKITDMKLKNGNKSKNGDHNMTESASFHQTLFYVFHTNSCG